MIYFIHFYFTLFYLILVCSDMSGMLVRLAVGPFRGLALASLTFGRKVLASSDVSSGFWSFVLS